MEHRSGWQAAVVAFIAIALSTACAFETTPEEGTASSALASASAPRVFFTDLTSGPKSGGEGGLGAFVTIYGSGFGSTRGTSTVTFGGGAVAAYRSWTDREITVQLGAQAASGNVVVRVGGRSSNGVPFNVRVGGEIFFVATNGSDSNSGSFSSPWRTLLRAKSALGPGDIVYVRNGVQQLTDGNNAASLYLGSSVQNGTAEDPIAIVAYPGALATIGCSDSASAGVTCRKAGIEIRRNHWVVAGMTLRASEDIFQSNASYVDGVGIRIVGNTVPEGSYYGIDFHYTGRTKVLGNEIFNHTNSLIYFGGYGVATDVEVAWNVVHGAPNGNGIKFLGHEAGDQLTNVRVHDNIVYDTGYPGIWIGDGTSENLNRPWLRDVLVYNNVVRHTGWNYGSTGFEGGCMRLGNAGNYAATIDVQIFHNTFVDCGVSIDAEHVARATIRNNVFYQLEGRPFLEQRGGTIVMERNLYAGGAPLAPIPSFETSRITGDPLFVDPATLDFRVRSGSPVIDRGLTTIVGADLAGEVRPLGSAPDVGAFEFVPAPVIAPTELIVDTGAAGTSFSGTWSASGGTPSYGAASLFAKTASNTYYQFRFDGTPGRYDVYAWWTEWPSRAENVPFQVAHAGGTSTVSVDQRTNGGRWNRIGSFDLVAGNTVRIISTSDTLTTSADAIRFVPTATAPQALIIDNRDASTLATGDSWPVSGATGAYGADSVYSKTPDATFEFLFNGTGGQHDVYVWWTQWPSRSLAVPVEIEHAGGTATVAVNQRIGGGRWHLLGRFDVRAGDAVRLISTSELDSTCADAVRFLPVL